MRLRNSIVVFSLLAFAISITFITSCIDKKPANQEGSIKNLVDGKDISLDDFKGYVLIVDFWATWCPPCRTEIPWFIEFYEKYKDRKFAVIGISVDRGGETVVKKFIKQFRMNYPVIMATKQLVEEYEKAIGQPIRAIPVTVIKNRAGKIASVHVGVPRDPDPKGLFEQEIQKLLEESQVI